MSRITNADVADTLSGELGLAKQAAKDTVKVFCNTIVDALADGNEVTLTGFGKFTTVDRPARTRNVFGEEMDIPAKTVAKFKPSKNLREAVEG